MLVPFHKFLLVCKRLSVMQKPATLTRFWVRKFCIHKSRSILLMVQSIPTPGYEKLEGLGTLRFSGSEYLPPPICRFGHLAFQWYRVPTPPPPKKVGRIVHFQFQWYRVPPPPLRNEKLADLNILSFSGPGYCCTMKVTQMASDVWSVNIYFGRLTETYQFSGLLAKCLALNEPHHYITASSEY